MTPRFALGFFALHELGLAYYRLRYGPVKALN
jgi:hypothetical protein